jgi:peptidoglycan-N-acetylglucosamine deacetylase
MKFNWIKTNSLIKKLFSNYVWEIPNNENKVFLTFDDGPTPEITEWTLSQLKSYNAKATFFCIGDNIRKHPTLFRKVIQDGHSIGNHTFNHLNGWKTNLNIYCENVELCEKELSEGRKLNSGCIQGKENLKSELRILNSKIFRPPYGKIKPSQSKTLRRQGYKIIMWDVISYDFDSKTAPEECLKNVLNNVKSGSIIVFHDSIKAFKNLEFVLPRTLEFLKEKGFTCEPIN